MEIKAHGEKKGHQVLGSIFLEGNFERLGKVEQKIPMINSFVTIKGI